MAPFLVFSGPQYDPGPGWEDMRGVRMALAGAHALVQLCRAFGFHWYQIVDMATLTVVESGAFAGRDEFGEDGWIYTPVRPDNQKWVAFLARQKAEHLS